MSQLKDPVDRLVDAYEAMLERVHTSAEDAEKRTLPWLSEALADAKEKAIELGELTREEADKISTYVERDIHEAADFIVETGKEFNEWLRFDVSLLQDRMLDMLSGMADHTSEALRDIADRARQASTYNTGEITAPGMLQCVACGEILHFDKTGHIPPCPKCHATEFKRLPHHE